MLRPNVCSSSSSANVVEPHVILNQGDSFVIKIVSVVSSGRIFVGSKFSRNTDGKPVGSFEKHTGNLVGLVHMRADLLAFLDIERPLFIWNSSTAETEGILKKFQIPGICRDIFTKSRSEHLAVQTDVGKLQILVIKHDYAIMDTFTIMQTSRFE